MIIQGILVRKVVYMDLFEFDNMQDADGVDFVPIFYDTKLAPIYCSYTKEEFKNIKYCPKSNRRYWKLINGKKEYIK